MQRSAVIARSNGPEILVFYDENRRIDVAVVQLDDGEDFAYNNLNEERGTVVNS